MGCESSNPQQVSQPNFQQNQDDQNYLKSKKHQSIGQFYSGNYYHKQRQFPNKRKYQKIFKKAKKLCEQQKFEDAELSADLFFKNGYLDQAIQLYQMIISLNFSYNYPLEGIGNKPLCQSYFQWTIYQWYDQQRKSNKIKSSPYDALSLCYIMHSFQTNNDNFFKKGANWYKKIIKQHPQNYKLLYGYSNILFCQGFFDQSIKFLDRVIAIKPQFIYSYLSKAYIYEYKRIQKKKANQLALKVLELTIDNSCFASFILARNIENIDQKILKLKQAHDRYPEYTRITNQIGICYGGTKNLYEQAIQWYKKCLQQRPRYYSSCNNIGVNYQLMKKYDQARQWYYKAIIISPQYKSPHDNLKDVYDELGYNNDQIQQQISHYPQINKGWFYSKLGTSYYNNKQYQKAIYWQKKSIQFDPNNHIFYNSYAISLQQYDDRFDQCIQNYKKCIQINPQFYSAYYNLGYAYKQKNRYDQAILWYSKSTQINPRYEFAYNNIGNIYKDRQDYELAIQNYERAVQHNTGYTLAWCNLGYCYSMVLRYKDAYNAFTTAKQCLPNDNNNLSQQNKEYLKKQIAYFQNMGTNWGKIGSITDSQKQVLRGLITQFQKKFKNIGGGISKVNMPIQKIFNKQVLQIIKLINQDKFQLKNIRQIFDLVQLIFIEDQEYFHIIPLLIIENFISKVFQKKQPILQVQSQLKLIMKELSQKVWAKQKQDSINYSKQNITLQLKLCKATNKSVNLFKDSTYFLTYQQLYIQINRINIAARKYYTNFSQLVEQVRKKSKGIPGGIGTKIPVKQSQQFKVILRIMQKMFKNEINGQKVTQMILKVDQNLKHLQSITLANVVKKIMETWNQQMTNIVKKRMQDQVQTECYISDLIRAKCIYTSLSDLAKAVETVDKICYQNEYTIIQLENRLSKPQTKDVVFKIQIFDAICQLQLAMKQDQTLFHLDHSVYQILRSPLGSIFGSYLFMSKEIKYSLTANCQDILDKIKKKKQLQDKQLILQAVKYILKVMKK